MGGQFEEDSELTASPHLAEAQERDVVVHLAVIDGVDVTVTADIAALAALGWSAMRWRDWRETHLLLLFIGLV